MTFSSTDPEITGHVFDIQGLSVHDGPGCRTVVFLSGCSLQCDWCSNPEGLSARALPLLFASKCIVCKNCKNACKQHAIKVVNERIIIDRSLCAACEDPQCTHECYTGALRLSNHEISLSALMDIIRRDRQYWGSEGGISLSGGEPLLQIDFAEAILKQCHTAYIHTAIESCGNVPWQHFQRVLPYLDWIFFDLKHFDTEAHLAATTAGNQQIQENAYKLAEAFKGRLIFRLPLIPGFNDTEENITALIAFLKETKKTEVNILPLHHLGREKYALLDAAYPGSKYPIPFPERMIAIQQLCKEAGINAYLGSETPF